MIAMHRQYVRPIFIEHLIDESKQASGIDETLPFTSESDLDDALRKVNFVLFSRNGSRFACCSSILSYVIDTYILIMVLI